MTLDTKEFASECERRLIDIHTLGLELNLRSRKAIWARVETGKLPAPIFKRQNILTLWDRDSIPELSGK